MTPCRVMHDVLEREVIGNGGAVLLLLACGHVKRSGVAWESLRKPASKRRCDQCADQTRQYPRFKTWRVWRWHDAERRASATFDFAEFIAPAAQQNVLRRLRWAGVSKDTLLAIANDRAWLAQLATENPSPPPET